MVYDYFNFIPFSLNDQITNLCLHTLDCIEGQTEALKHFLPMFLKAAKDIVVGLTFIQLNVMHHDLR